MQVAGVRTKRRPHTQQILLRLLRSVSSAAPETITFSHGDFFLVAPNPPLPLTVRQKLKEKKEGGGKKRDSP